MDLEGDWVAFRISDVFLPGAAELLLSLDEDTLLVGRLVGYSDSGSRTKAFGIVDLGERRVIVARDKLLGLDIRPSSQEKE